MAQIKKAYSEDFEKIYPLMLEFNNPQLTRADWQKLFVSRWYSQENHFGYYIEEEEQIVGFLGTIFSQRIIDGKPRNFCNLSTWIVKEPYRGSSLLLLFEAMKLKEYTITNLTANRVAGILRKVGFRDLSNKLIVFFPIPYPTALFNISRITRDNHLDGSALNSDEQQVFQDHQRLQCHHLIIHKGNEHCYIIYDVIQRKRLPVARLHYISNPKWFARNAHVIALKFCINTKTFGLFIAENLFRKNEYKNALVIPQKQAMVYHSDELSNHEIDTLYSELQVLGIRH